MPLCIICIENVNVFLCVCTCALSVYTVQCLPAALLCLWRLTKGPWCCSSSVSRCGPVVLLLSSPPVISKTQSDCSVPALIRLPGSSLCVAGWASKSASAAWPSWTLNNLSHTVCLWCLGCVIFCLWANRKNIFRCISKTSYDVAPTFTCLF